MQEENWKQKYLASLDNLEKQEKRGQAIEAVLKQGLTRVALAAQGLDAKLDDDLALLRKILRKDIDLNHLESVVADLTHSVKQLDDQRNDKSAAHSPQKLLTHWLDSLSFPGPLTARIKALRQKIDSTSSLNEMEAPLRELAELVNEALQHEDHPIQSREQGGGFFSRLFGGDSPGKRRSTKVASCAKNW